MFIIIGLVIMGTILLLNILGFVVAGVVYIALAVALALIIAGLLAPK